MEGPADQAWLDHVAVRVADRDAVCQRLLRHLDWQVFERDDRLTLLGPDAERGKLTLLDASPRRHGPTPSGRLVSVLLALGIDEEPRAPVELADGVLGSFVRVDALDASWPREPRHAVVGISLRANDPALAAAWLEADFAMHVVGVGAELALLDLGATTGTGRLTLSRERWDMQAEGPLDHVGVRVPDAAAWRTRAEGAGLEVVRWTEAAHSRAVFVRGPEGLVVEFVELVAPLGG